MSHFCKFLIPTPSVEKMHCSSRGTGAHKINVFSALAYEILDNCILAQGRVHCSHVQKVTGFEEDGAMQVDFLSKK
jgi:hypothetical protein